MLLFLSRYRVFRSTVVFQVRGNVLQCWLTSHHIILNAITFPFCFTGLIIFHFHPTDRCCELFSITTPLQVLISLYIPVCYMLYTVCCMLSKWTHNTYFIVFISDLVGKKISLTI